VKITRDPSPKGSSHRPTERTELICVYCDALDPIEMPEAKKWAVALQ